MTRPGIVLSLILGIAAFAADRLHKYVQMDLMHWPEGRFVPVLPFLDLGFVYNRGVSFGLLGSLPFPVVIGVVTVALLALIVWWARSTSTLVRAGLAICIGGAVSNALDRWLFGAVADFFWLHWGETSFFVFNVADVAISLGVCLLLLDLTGIARKRTANPA
ncbi:MAG: signal peptidase II [Devosia sp.]|uniref:signal peptidase II n=1 Tax=Devosia sp. 66-22 TaxID=1895753 RepID=UPI0009286E12|nr:signal peptidase II [Devosia sp. 66-22]MBN9347636.1 signal peptidase II [Devosia sp.]OJX51251.1 MAG: signal peptidase II [Devosia sp. 66-22]